MLGHFPMEKEHTDETICTNSEEGNQLVFNYKGIIMRVFNNTRGDFKEANSIPALDMWTFYTSVAKHAEMFWLTIYTLIWGTWVETAMNIIFSLMRWNWIWLALLKLTGMNCKKLKSLTEQQTMHEGGRVNGQPPLRISLPDLELNPNRRGNINVLLGGW